MISPELENVIDAIQHLSKSNGAIRNLFNSLDTQQVREKVVLPVMSLYINENTLPQQAKQKAFDEIISKAFPEMRFEEFTQFANTPLIPKSIQYLFEQAKKIGWKNGHLEKSEERSPDLPQKTPLEKEEALLPIQDSKLSVQKQEIPQKERKSRNKPKPHISYDENQDFLKVIAEEVRKRILAENPQAHITKEYIQKIRCSVCEKNEVWAYYEKPFALICQRANKCGSTIQAKNLYPEYFISLSERFPSNPEDLNATATAYLIARGLDPSKIQYNQGQVKDKDSGKKYQTLKIQVDSEVIFHRLIDYKGKDKTRIWGNYKGKVWKPEILDFSKEIWVVEGILDALSLIQSGIQAIAILSSAHLPEKFYETSEIRQAKIVLAFDNDLAGKKAIEKHIRYFEEKNCGSVENKVHYEVALPPLGKDWNDLLIEGALEEGFLEGTIIDCRWRGCIYQAKSPEAYFEIYCQKYGNYPAIFEFRNQLFKGWTKQEKENLLDEDGSIKGHTLKVLYKVFRLADCSIKILYSIEDDSILYQSKTKHRLELHSYREGKSIVEFTSEELAQLSYFKTRLTHYRQIFFGKSEDLTSVIEYLFRQKAPKIRQCHALGYDRKSQCFVFSKFLYDPEGKRFETNEEGYFKQQKIAPFPEKTVGEIVELEIPLFLEILYNAYSYRGLSALGFWAASLFSHLIFDKFGFFPFLSMYGDSRCGKSDLTKMLNRCFFLDWEGISMTRANTQKGELRKISQKSSLVTPMLEGRKDKSRFDYDAILSAYNRNSTQIRAKNTNDNETHELPFESTLVFVQNQEQFISKAAKERVISIHFRDKDLTDESYTAWQNLMEYSPEQLAFIGHSILSERKWFEAKMLLEIQENVSKLKTLGIKVDRIAKNHAIALSGASLFCQKFGNRNDFEGLLDYVFKTAKTKIETARTENLLADHFFESMFSLRYEETHGTESVGYLVKGQETLVLHLPTVLKNLEEQNFKGWNKREVTEALNEVVLEKKQTRDLDGTVKDCWIFKHEEKSES